MRKTGKLLLCLALALTLCLVLLPGAQADDEQPTSGTCGANLTWTLDAEGNLTISGTGAMEDYYYWDDYGAGNVEWVEEYLEWKIGPWGQGIKTVTINEGVTSIGGGAFKGCNKLARVEIPPSVTAIGGGAFTYCSSLTGVYITDLCAWCEISFSTIEGFTANPLEYAHNLYLNGTQIKELSIPLEVNCVKEYSFSGCSSLTSVTVSKNLKSIGSHAFSGCNALEGVYIDDLVAWCQIKFSDNPLRYAHQLYLNGSLLTDLTIPESVTNIGSYAFSGCSPLTSIVIPESVTNIGSYAFSGCSSLANIVIPESVTRIGGSAFSGCSSLVSVVIPESVTRIEGSAFSGCSSLVSVVIPESVTRIEGSAFSGCSSLTSVVIPESVTRIEDGVFSGCSSLTSVVIPESVTRIGGSAFSGCSALTSISIPTTIKSIGNTAFVGCNSLKDVNIYDLAAWCRIKFSSADSNPLCCGGRLYLNGALLTEIEFPSELTKVSDYAFSGCSSLTKVILPNNLKYGYGVFFNCPNLISAGPIGGDDALQFMWTNTIPQNAFSGCSMLTSIKIPFNIESIKKNAFKGCTALKDIQFDGYKGTAERRKNSGWITEGNEEFFDTAWQYKQLKKGWTPCGDDLIYQYDQKTQTLTVKGSGTMWEWSERFPCPWEDKISKIKSVVLEQGVTSVSDNSFRNCMALTSLKLPDSLETIDYQAFDGCTGLKTAGPTGSGCNIEFGWKKTISKNLFARFGSLKTVTIPEGVTSIGARAFSYCSALTSVTIPASVTSIGARAFSGCEFLKSISIPQGVKTIKAYTFEDCRSLASVVLPKSLKMLEAYAFDGCDWLTDVYYTGTKTQWGKISISTDGNYAINRAEKHYSFVVLTAPTAKGSHSAKGKPVLSWKAVDGAVKYQVYRSTTGKDGSFKLLKTVEKLKYTNSKATVGKTYYYKVRAVSADGTKGPFSSVVKLTCKPATPNVTGTLNAKGKPVLTWEAVTGAAKYQIYRSATGKSGSFKLIKTVDKLTYTNAKAAEGKTFYYKVRAVSANGTKGALSKIVTLTVTSPKPAITAQPKDVTAAAGETAKFTVKVSGPNLSYQWQYRTSASGTWKNATATGNKTTSLQVPVTAKKDGYQYRCKIKNAAGTVTTKAVTLTVAAKPAVTTQPKNVTAAKGETVTFKVKATGAGLSYQWQYRTSASGSWQNCSSKTKGYNTATLQVEATAKRNGYQYRCVITNGAGKVTTKAVTLTVQ